MNPIVWIMQVGLREVMTSPRLHCCSAERLGFKSTHFDPRGCTVIRWIHRGGKCLGLCVHGLSCSRTRGIFLDQGLKLCPLHWQADSYPLYHKERPILSSFKLLTGCLTRVIHCCLFNRPLSGCHRGTCHICSVNFTALIASSSCTQGNRERAAGVTQGY